MIKKIVLGCFFVAIMAVPCMAQEKAIVSDDALAYLNLDIENNPGWVAGIKGGYQWKLFRGAGIQLNGTNVSHSVSRNFTKGGAAGSVSFGYNFGQRFPLTLGLVFGHGPAGKLNTHSTADIGGTPYNVHSYQRARIYTFDLSADYDFKNCSRWTPFVGLTGGLGFVSQHGYTELRGGGDYIKGGYEKRKRINAIVGARAGTKWKLNECVTFSLYGSYSYLGKVPSKSYSLAGGTYNVRTQKITAHQLDLKFGIKISF